MFEVQGDLFHDDDIVRIFGLCRISSRLIEGAGYNTSSAACGHSEAAVSSSMSEQALNIVCHPFFVLFSKKMKSHIEP